MKTGSIREDIKGSFVEGNTPRILAGTIYNHGKLNKEIEI